MEMYIVKPIPVKIIEVKEPWCEAILEDGTTIKAKLVFVSIYRRVNEDGSFVFETNHDGSQVPSYIVNNQAMMAVDWTNGSIEEKKVTAQVLKLVENEKEEN